MFLKNLFFKNTTKQPNATYNKNSYSRKLHESYIQFAKEILSYDFSTGYATPVYKKVDVSHNIDHQLHAINKLIRILALDIQNSLIQDVFLKQDHFRYSPVFDCYHAYFQKYNLKSKAIIYDLDTPYPFDISQNPTISSPHNSLRLLNALGRISSQLDNPFSFKKSNHFESILYAPINLLILSNGFHSSVAGIYDTNAIFYPAQICDISNLYQEIYFDGLFFRYLDSNTVIQCPENKSIGTIFEIGRLLYERNLSLVSIPPNI